MKKSLRLIIIIIFSTLFGAGIFSFVVAEKLYFPEIKEIANDTGAGLSLTAYQYDPWLWNSEKTTIINILDWKNDAPNLQYKFKKEVNGVRLIHSGENFALIAYNGPDFSSMESGYVVNRSPKVEGENTVEEIHIGGNIIAVAPDESGYFYISKNKIFKRGWEGETIMTVNLGMVVHPISDIQLISVGTRNSSHPVLFFDNNKKMSFVATPGSWKEAYLFIWDLEKNQMEKTPVREIENYSSYNNFVVENDKLYFELINNSISKKLIAE